MESSVRREGDLYTVRPIMKVKMKVFSRRQRSKFPRKERRRFSFNQYLNDG